jgi:hypothetical protein
MTCFISSLSIFLFSSKIGLWMDASDRLQFVQIAVAAKIVSIIGGYGLCSYMIFYDLQHSSIKYLLPLFYSLGQLSFSTVTTCLEKDWVVVLAGGDSSWLSGANSFMTMIDLSCECLAPIVAGVLYEYSLNLSGLVLIVCSLFSAGVFVAVVRSVYHDVPALHTRTDSHDTSTDTDQDANPTDKTAPAAGTAIADEDEEGLVQLLPSERSCVDMCKDAVSEVVCAYNTFAASGCVYVMLGYSALYLTYLQFGSIMTVYLLQETALSGSVVGVCRALSALSGFTGAALYVPLRNRIGIWKTGMVSVWSQWVCVSIACLSFASVTGSREGNVSLLLGASLLSRAGLWCFDLVVRQIAQETIPTKVRGTVNGVWNTLTASVDMLGYGLGMVFSSTNTFWLLALLTCGAIFVAGCLFSVSFCRNKGNISAVIPSSGGVDGMGRDDECVSCSASMKEPRQQELEITMSTLHHSVDTSS